MDGYLYVEYDGTNKYSACAKYTVLNIRPLTDGKCICHFDLNGQCYAVRVL